MYLEKASQGLFAYGSFLLLGHRRAGGVGGGLFRKGWVGGWVGLIEQERREEREKMLRLSIYPSTHPPTHPPTPT